ncbi:unnamed protein product [Paramecium pentaurelia]|uniref:Uncharacterized protein n=1 Tax=Paramecium pentaurelia TaxID=43138 RepID=A0A8S1VWW1_9CILI|nr:unnamed protein product [Paramecium pentaurelia]
MEQIKHLKWQGVHEMSDKKHGRWIAFWNGEILSEVGGYFENGLKQGLWKELFKNYSSHSKSYESGEYQNDKRSGMWIYIYDNNIIGGGKYNEQGQKSGKWIELSDSFNCNSQLTYYGEYKGGKKVGRWDIKYKNEPIGKNGGGLYNEGGQGIKIGSWVEVDDNFNDSSEITHNGKYKNGQKIGRWDIHLNCQGLIKQIGGGLYDERGDGHKVGKWIELSEGFYKTYQIIFNGNYQNGKKVGQWDIYLNNEKIGGGLYDEMGEGKKIGRWIEVGVEFIDSFQITQNGEYKNGKKIGQWDIFQKNTCGNHQIRERLYNEEGLRSRFGRNNRIRNSYLQAPFESEYKNIKKPQGQDTHFDTKGGMEIIDSNLYITQIGEYFKGQKVGKWDFFFINKEGSKEMGGGYYENYVIDLKIGRWIEFNDFNSQITYVGEYKKGQKVGRWDTYLNYFGNKLIGGGSYDEGDEGFKCGRWIEVNDELDDSSQVTINGEYKNGNKVGKWDIYLNYVGNIKIGGGSYDNESFGVKTGKWVDIKDGFKWALQTTFNGQYGNGNKIGKCVEMQGQIKSREMNFKN